MTTTPLTLDNRIQMTRQVGENWVMTHAKRRVALAQDIGADIVLPLNILH